MRSAGHGAAHVCNPSTKEAEDQVPGQSRPHKKILSHQIQRKKMYPKQNSFLRKPNRGNYKKTSTHKNGSNDGKQQTPPMDELSDM